jgi:flavin reductase (DIM6/NTAB) family NADH-FMN oxidoreductase RutF
MKRIFEQKNIFCLPWAQTILGTHLNGKVNFMALDWLTRVNIAPPTLGICVNKNHASHGAVIDTGEFSINLSNYLNQKIIPFCPHCLQRALAPTTYPLELTPAI